MLFDSNRCFSPISFDDEASFDGMLMPSSECTETRSIQSEAACCISIDSDSPSTTTAAPPNGKGRKQSLRKGRRNSTAEEVDRTKPPGTVGRRNERERNRVKQVNLGFDRLRQYVRLPGSIGAKKKLSKVDTLRAAVDYIAHLKKLLSVADAIPSTVIPPGTAADIDAHGTNAAQGVDGCSGISRNFESCSSGNQLGNEDCHQLLTYMLDQQERTTAEHQQRQQPRLDSEDQPTYLNVEGLSEATQLLMRHSMHQFPQLQQPTFVVNSELDLQQSPHRPPPTTTAVVGNYEDLFPTALGSIGSCEDDDDVFECKNEAVDDGFYEIDTFLPSTQLSSVVMTSPEAATQFQPSPNVASSFSSIYVDQNDNYYNQSSFPVFFDTSYLPSVPSIQPMLAVSGSMMTSLSPPSNDISVGNIGDDNRRLADLKTWLMTGC